MAYLKSILLFALCVLSFSIAEESNQANLLLHKRILNRFLVEGKELIVEYSIYNVGSGAAYDVNLSETNFPSESFELVTGLLKMRLERLGSGANISHSLVLKPKISGYYNFTSAEVSYLPTEDASEPQVGFSTQPGEGLVIPLKDFDRQFSPHLLDWGVFGAITLPSLAIPFLLWLKSKSKYEVITKQSKKH